MKKWLFGVIAGLIVGGVVIGGLVYYKYNQPLQSDNQSLQIADGMRVTMEYTLILPDKTVADSTKGQPPFSYTQGKQEVIPGLEKALVGLKAGDKKHVTIPAAEAYGLYDEKKKVPVPKKNVPPDVKVGTKLRSQSGQEANVVEIKGDSVVVDVNHPLAGKDLTFDVNIVNVEKAPPPVPKPAK
jgi:FKBP-type peptidyl-prolyl cis-trans isomerase 2